MGYLKDPNYKSQHLLRLGHLEVLKKQRSRSTLTGRAPGRGLFLSRRRPSRMMRPWPPANPSPACARSPRTCRRCCARPALMPGGRGARALLEPRRDHGRIVAVALAAMGWWSYGQVRGSLRDLRAAGLSALPRVGVGRAHASGSTRRSAPPSAGRRRAACSAEAAALVQLARGGMDAAARLPLARRATRCSPRSRPSSRSRRRRR